MIALKFKSAVLKEKVEPLCQRVLSYFQLPDYKLLSYIDDEIPPDLPRLHASSSGIHTPIFGGGRWPHYVEEWFYTREKEFAFDNLIYIPGTKYIGDPVTFTMIFAHELQHFMQYGQSRLAYKVNCILFGNVGEFDRGAMAWDIPYERDAMIASKRVIEAEFGTPAVQQSVEKQIADTNANGNFSKKEVWNFLNTLSSAADYDWREETCRLIQRYRPYLETTVDAAEMRLLNTWVRLGRNIIS
ncbi:MAG: hypothetical protein LAN70_00255 [Acidobacteriia bacterium]|nr:hypothetical protein [Terriglobia bacterium]